MSSNRALRVPLDKVVSRERDSQVARKAADERFGKISSDPAEVAELQNRQTAFYVYGQERTAEVI